MQILCFRKIQMIIEVQKNILRVNNCRHFSLFSGGKKLIYGKIRVNFLLLKSKNIRTTVGWFNRNYLFFLREFPVSLSVPLAIVLKSMFIKQTDKQFFLLFKINTFLQTINRYYKFILFSFKINCW